MCIVFGYPQFNKIPLLCLGKFPLFPYAHAYSVIEPLINVIYVVLHACYAIIVKPTSRIYLDFLKTRLDGLYRLTEDKSFSFDLNFFHDFG